MIEGTMAYQEACKLKKQVEKEAPNLRVSLTKVWPGSPLAEAQNIVATEPWWELVLERKGDSKPYRIIDEGGWEYHKGRFL